MDEAVNGNGDDLLVGRRKRRVRWDMREDAAQGSPTSSGEDYYMVPPERALVPMSVYADSKR